MDQVGNRSGDDLVLENVEKTAATILATAAPSAGVGLQSALLVHVPEN